MPTDSRNPRVALSGTRIDRKTSTSRKNASPTTTSRYFGKASARLCEMSTPTAVWPVTRARAPVSSGSAANSSRRVSTSSLVATSDGPLSGTTVMIAKPSGRELLLVRRHRLLVARVHDRRDDGGDVVRHPGGDGHRGIDRGGRVGGVLRVDHDGERAVGALPEVRGDQVVGLTTTRVGRRRPVVGQGELHRGEREGDDRGDGQSGDQRRHPETGHEVDPAAAVGAHVVALGVAVLQPGQRGAGDAPARVGQQGRQQGERDRDRDRDGGGARQAHLGQEA